MKYRKKPVVIEAFQWNGGGAADWPDWFRNSTHNAVGANPNPPTLVIYTLEGAMRADPGDWIIRGVQGELYPCKPNIFAETYEAVE